MKGRKVLRRSRSSSSLEIKRHGSNNGFGLSNAMGGAAGQFHHQSQGQSQHQHHHAISASEPNSADPCDDMLCRWGTCSAEFDDLNALRMHVKEVHIGGGRRAERVTACGWEGCSYVNREPAKRHNLVSHVAVHIKLRTFRCVHCDAAFKRGNDLKRHIERKHPSADAHASFVASTNPSKSGSSVSTRSRSAQQQQMQQQSMQQDYKDEPVHAPAAASSSTTGLSHAASGKNSSSSAHQTASSSASAAKASFYGPSSQRTVVKRESGSDLISPSSDRKLAPLSKSVSSESYYSGYYAPSSGNNGAGVAPGSSSSASSSSCGSAIPRRAPPPLPLPLHYDPEESMVAPHGDEIGSRELRYRGSQPEMGYFMPSEGMGGDEHPRSKGSRILASPRSVPTSPLLGSRGHRKTHSQSGILGVSSASQGSLTGSKSQGHLAHDASAYPYPYQASTQLRSSLSHPNLTSLAHSAGAAVSSSSAGAHASVSPDRSLSPLPPPATGGPSSRRNNAGILPPLHQHFHQHLGANGGSVTPTNALSPPSSPLLTRHHLFHPYSASSSSRVPIGSGLAGASTPVLGPVPSLSILRGVGMGRDLEGDTDEDSEHDDADTPGMSMAPSSGMVSISDAARRALLSPRGPASSLFGAGRRIRPSRSRGADAAAAGAAAAAGLSAVGPGHTSSTDEGSMSHDDEMRTDAMEEVAIPVVRVARKPPVDDSMVVEALLSLSGPSPLR
jgi:hypothetical protein